MLETGGAPETSAAENPKPMKESGKARVWLVATKPVTMALRWGAGCIRGHVECDGEYSIELDTGGRKVEVASFNGNPVNVAFDQGTQRVRLDISGSGYLEV